jgi:NADPH-dependent 2,4-dienoyl-CoA reductase/sulfur reductase-like enzyme
VLVGPDRLARVVVVGGGLGATRTIAQLRRRGYEGEVVLLGAENRPPYDRPPLSKAVLAGHKDDTTLRFDPAALHVDLRLGTPATGLDLARRVVRTDAGDVPFDRLVVATGARPVRLPGPGEQLALRTLDDALALRARLVHGARVVLIGASWIGAEVATAALARGCSVTCLEAGPAPLAQALGDEMGATFLPWWRDVDLRTGTAVASVEDGRVELADGTAVSADVVVTGVGVRPETGWLADSGLALDRGVVVDEHLFSSDPDILAVGDVAARWSPRLGAHVRIEHWEDAGSAGSIAAASLLADDPADRPVHDPVPYFWSDQFGHKVQYVGSHRPGDRPVEREPGEAPGRTVTWLDDAGRISAVLTVDRPRESAAAARLVADGRVVPPAELRAAAGTLIPA